MNLVLPIKQRAADHRTPLLVIALVAAVLLAPLGLGAVAQAEPAQQFTFRISSAKPGGQVALGLALRTYDTTGAVPPAPTSFYLRMPRGAAVREQFLDGHWFCDGPALRDALDSHPSGTPFTKRVANLRPFIRELARSKSRADGTALPNARTCERARLGNGTGLIDARKIIDLFSDPIPIRFSVFLSRGDAPGALVAITVLGAADVHAPLVRRNPVLAGVHAAITESIVDDPTPDGLYGYKLILPTGKIGGFDISLAEVRATVHGLQIPKGACLKRNRRGGCARRQRADLFSFVVPPCPASGQLYAQLFSGFALPTPSLTTTLALACPRFS
jgi:hypothetical protein